MQTMLTPDPLEERGYFAQSTTSTTPLTETTRAPKVGDIVNYVLESGRNKGAIRAAIVARTWGSLTSAVQLQVFTDGHNDDFVEIHMARMAGGQEAAITLSQNVVWRLSVPYSEDHEPGTWHWPTRDIEQFPVIEALQNH